MRLVHVEPEDAWALVDERVGLLRLVSGGVTAWGGRIAGGEGVWALPINGRLASRPQDSIGCQRFRRILGGDDAGEGEMLATVLGAPLEGRRDPLRSVCGYMLAAGPPPDDRLGPVLMTPDEFQDAPAILRDGVQVSAPECLRRMDATYGLKSGDVVILGTPLLTDHQHAKLSSPRPFESRFPLDGRRPAMPGPGPTA